MNYFATPVSSDNSYKNYNKTVIEGVKSETLKRVRIKKIEKFSSDIIHIWGIKADKRTRWVKVDKG